MNNFRIPLVARVCAAFFLLMPTLGKESVRPVSGLHRFTPRIHALTNATVWTTPDERIENATIVLRDGLIEAVGAEVPVPPDARVWDMSGKVVYAGFIDAYSDFGLPEGLRPFRSKRPEPGEPPKSRPATPAETGFSHWNALVTPERDTVAAFGFDAKKAESYQEVGFTSVAVFPGRGIFRGEGAMFNLKNGPVNETVIKTRLAQHVAFETSYFDWEKLNGEVPYPSSLMGSIALTRQTLYDARWYTVAQSTDSEGGPSLEPPEESEALAALGPLSKGEAIALFATYDELDYERVGRVANEFGLSIALLGNGYEYRRLEMLSEMRSTVIVPLLFPKAPRVERADAALDVSLEQLQHWELAPSNAAFLEKAGIAFCLTSHFLPELNGFWPSVRSAVKRGLSPRVALAALTTTPAKLYALDDRLGSVVSGRMGNLTIATGDLFADEKAKVAMVWVDGEPVRRDVEERAKLVGEWRFRWSGTTGFESGAFAGEDKDVSLKVGDRKVSVSLSGSEALLFADQALFGGEEGRGIVRLQGYVSGDEIWGSGVDAAGNGFSWAATRSTAVAETAARDDAKDEPEEVEIPALVFDRYPAGEYGVVASERPETVVVRNATIWTSGPAGVLHDADLLVREGKIEKVGPKLKAPKGALEIDAQGLHVTPGLIDCHSHTAIEGGFNEIGSAITVEVRVGDVLNPVDINLYRKLAGGVTTSNLLHGSANPMGGQNQVIKTRWGEGAEGLKLVEAMPGVKFALGENVKQSNWGDHMTNRYPQTRMGVEQFMESNFRAAEDYERKWMDHDSGKVSAPPRRDLRMEAALEILRGKRSVHIHSYRQDEILMFARLAARRKLDVAAFQHVLEGYKVAAEIAAIGAGGSTFSDWWGFKFEVQDAIPYNGALMSRVGVLTSFNSDDDELSTRLNTEAAKAVKYGGVSEDEALRFVTLNAALQLRIADRVGSLEAGKDADFVLWSAHPLSTYARVEQTWIDGALRFARTRDEEMRQRDLKERERLMQKALAARLKEMKLEPAKDKVVDASKTESSDAAPTPDFWRRSIYDGGDHQEGCSEHGKETL